MADRRPAAARLQPRRLLPYDPATPSTPAGPMTERVLILDFGSQYTQLIARRVREHRVYCEIHPCTVGDAVRAPASRPAAIILSGGPASTHEAAEPARTRGRVRARRAGAGRLLRRADHVRPARRPGRALPPTASIGRAEITPRPALAAVRRPPRPGPALHRLDEPRRPHHRHPAGLRRHRPERHLALRRHRRRGAPLLRRPVPPRGRPHRDRRRPPAELPVPHRGLAGDWSMHAYREQAIAAHPRPGRPRPA